LLRAGLPPAVIFLESRRDYLLALQEAEDQGNRAAFIDFIGENLDATVDVAARYLNHRNGTV